MFPNSPSKGVASMKIIDILNQDRPTLSFEVFPPKTSDT